MSDIPDIDEFFRKVINEEHLVHLCENHKTQIDKVALENERLANLVRNCYYIFQDPKTKEFTIDHMAHWYVGSVKYPGAYLTKEDAEKMIYIIKNGIPDSEYQRYNKFNESQRTR